MEYLKKIENTFKRAPKGDIEGKTESNFKKLFEPIPGTISESENGFVIENQDLKINLSLKDFKSEYLKAYDNQGNPKDEVLKEIVDFKIESAENNIDIPKLLPPEWRIVWNSEGTVNEGSAIFGITDGNAIVISGSLKEPANIYTLLHEIGHTKDKSHESNEDFKELNELILSDNAGWKEEINKWIRKQTIKLDWGKPKIKKVLEDVLRSERNAHSYALRQIKPFLSDMKTDQQTLTDLFVHNLTLGSYTKGMDIILKELNIKI
jgi:hypothetical protein